MALGNKDIMAKNIKRLMEMKGVNASIICSELNIPMATFSDWCHGKTYPRIDKIELLSNYFGVSKFELVEDAAATSESADLQERTLISNYRKLSDDGRKDLVKRSDELVQLESLRKESRLGKDA